MKYSDIRLIVTIDVECDKSFNWRTSAPLSFRGVMEGIGMRLHPLFTKWGICPTYLLSPEVMTDQQSCDLLRSLPNCELGTHLHGDYIVPEIKTWEFADTLTDEMQCEYPPGVERAKLEVLTELFIQQFGYHPASFRAGRFGIGHQTGRWLEELGYKIDSSVTPHITWTSRTGDKFPDFSGFPEHPYTIGENGDIWNQGKSRLMEIPVTILNSGVLLPYTAEPAWFRPWYSNAETLTAIMQQVAQESTFAAVRRPLVMMFHNVELVAGASPYPQTESEVASYLEMLDQVFDVASQMGIRSCTLEEYYDEFDVGNNQSEPFVEQISVAVDPKELPAAGVMLKKEIDLPTSLVLEALNRHQAPSWFGYIFKERAKRWDVWQPCFWVAKNIVRDADILSTGCGAGFNLMWLAQNGFYRLYGFDIDENTVRAGADICSKANLPVLLWMDEGLAPKNIPSIRFSVIEALNWTMYNDKFSLDGLLDRYLPYLKEEGFIIFDVIDSSYDAVPNNQFITSDWDKPLEQRHPSEYRIRISEVHVLETLKARGLALVRTFSESQEVIPRKVYVAQKTSPISYDANIAEPIIFNSPKAFKINVAHDSANSPLRVLFLYDVQGWAWWHRAQQIKRNLPSDITIHLLQMNQPFSHHKYDFVVIFDPYLISLLADVPAAKIVIGCSCPEYLPQMVELVSSARCAAGFVNNRSMYDDAMFSLPNLFCCQNGVDEELFQPARSKSGEYVACWVGNSGSVGIKGLDLIVDACKSTNVSLVALDREANRDKEQLLTQEQVRDDVYHNATFYICASVKEGTPNPALEALACGLPVISTRVGNMPEIVRDGFNGFLVDRSAEAIVDAIEKLKKLNQGDLARNARSSILEGWTWSQQTEKYVHMFRTLSKAGRQFMDINLLNCAGAACLEKNDYEGACTTFSKVLAIDPHNRLAKYSRILAGKHLGAQ